MDYGENAFKKLQGHLAKVQVGPGSTFTVTYCKLIRQGAPLANHIHASARYCLPRNLGGERENSCHCDMILLHINSTHPC